MTQANQTQNRQAQQRHRGRFGDLDSNVLEAAEGSERPGEGDARGTGQRSDNHASGVRIGERVGDPDQKVGGGGGAISFAMAAVKFVWEVTRQKSGSRLHHCLRLTPAV